MKLGGKPPQAWRPSLQKTRSFQTKTIQNAFLSQALKGSQEKAAS